MLKIDFDDIIVEYDFPNRFSLNQAITTFRNLPLTNRDRSENILSVYDFELFLVSDLLYQNT